MSILELIALSFFSNLSDGCFSLREVCSSTNEARTVLRSEARCTSPFKKASVAASPLLNADCVVVVEYPVERGKPPFRIGELVGVRNRRYGRTALAFYAFKPSGALEALRPRPEEFEEFS